MRRNQTNNSQLEHISIGSELSFPCKCGDECFDDGFPVDLVRLGPFGLLLAVPAELGDGDRRGAVFARDF